MPMQNYALELGRKAQVGDKSNDRPGKLYYPTAVESLFLICICYYNWE